MHRAPRFPTIRKNPILKPLTDSDMKKLLLLIPMLVAFQLLKAQDEAIFTHYLITPILINPAAAGFGDNFQVQFNARAQWTGFPDAPQTFGAMFNGPVANNFGIGIGVFSESAAQMNRFKGQLNWAFKFNLSDDVKMAAGFSAAYQQMSLDNSIIGGNFYQPGDRVVEDGLAGRQDFDASVGVFGSVRENTRFGLSFANLIQTRLDGVVTQNNQSALQFYTFFFGHQFDIDGLNFTLEPSIMARKIKDSPSQIDINLRAGFLDEQLITGISYRTLGALGVLLGARVSNFNVFYSYDVSFQRFQRFNTGSHEVSVLLNLKFGGRQTDVERGY